MNAQRPWDCPDCGHRNPSDAAFCRGCGTALALVSDREPPVGRASDEPNVGLGQERT